MRGGGADYEFTFYSMAAGTGGKSYSVKDDVPQANGQYIYARSSVAGETWPANLEKAFIGVLGRPDLVSRRARTTTS